MVFKDPILLKKDCDINASFTTFFSENSFHNNKNYLICFPSPLPSAHTFLTKSLSHILSRPLIWTLHSIILTIYWFPRPDLHRLLSENVSSSFYTTTSLSFLRSQVQWVLSGIRYSSAHEYRNGFAHSQGKCLYTSSAIQLCSTEICTCPSAFRYSI